MPSSPLKAKLASAQARIRELEEALDLLQSAEQSRKASESFFEYAQSMAHLGSWTADLQKGTYESTPESARMVSWGPGTHSIDELNKIIHPEDLALQQSAWQRALEGAPFDIEHRILINGEIRWLHISAEIQTDPNGTPTRAIGITQDITEHKRAEQALFASEEKYRNLSEELEHRVIKRTAEVYDLYNRAPCGYHSLDENGRFIHINDTEINWLGYTREEILGCPVTCIIAAESLPIFLTTFAEYKKRGWLKDIELVFRRKDGSTFPVLVNATAQFDQDGHFVISRSTVFDITERKQAELALRASEQRLNFLLSKTPAVIFTTGLSENMPITFISDSAQKTFGYEPRQYLEDPGFWFSLIHPEDILPGKACLQVLFEKGYTHWQCRVRCSDGAYRWTSTGITLLRDAYGQPQEYIGYSVDIDNQKKAEAALQESEEQNRLLFEESPDAILLLDNEGKFVRVNRAFEALSTLSRGKMMGQTPIELGLITQEGADQFSQVLPQSNANNGTFSTLEHVLTSPDGKTHDLESRMYLLTINKKNHILVTSRDIASRKQAEEKLRLANAEMKRAMRVKDEFLASMSHELRTPLTGVLALSEGLQELVYGSLNERQLKALANIESAGHHLLDLINDILDVSKLEAGKIELQIEPCDIQQICQSGLQLVKGIANKKHQKSSFSMVPPEILTQGDPRRLKQILVNLLSNAVKYTPPGGLFGLAVEGNEEEGLLQIIIWDKGIGIKPEDVEKLFKPFVQLDSSLARQQTGTGLGLALVKHLIDLHGGSVHVESTYGEGSRFTVLLPWRRYPLVQKPPASSNETQRASTGAALAESSPGDPDPAAGAGRDPSLKPIPLVMVVDDNELNLKAMSDYLLARQFRVIVVNDSRDFLEQASQARPDIVLMDIQMPGMDGLEAIRQIRAHLEPEIASVPIIAVTALVMPGDRERCLSAGANEYLSKPIRLHRLVEFINELLKQSGVQPRK